MSTAKLKWIVMIAAILFASSRLVSAASETKFKISQKNSPAQAVVDSKKFEATMTLGDASEYDTRRIFEIVVGKCSLSITGYPVPSAQPNVRDIQYEVKEGEGPKSYVKNPSNFTATDKSLVLLGQDDDKPKNFTFCESSGVTFDKHPKAQGKYLIQVGLNGSSIPPNLELNSDNALLYDPNAKEEEPDASNSQANGSKDSAGGGLGTAAWIGIGCGILVLILLSVGGGIAAFCIIRRKKQQSIEAPKKGSAGSNVKTALAAEAIPDRAFLEKQRTLVGTQDETGDVTPTNEESSKKSRKATTKTEGADNIQKKAEMNGPALNLQAPEAKVTLVHPQAKPGDQNYEVLTDPKAPPPPPPPAKQDDGNYEPLLTRSQIAAATPAPRIGSTPNSKPADVKEKEKKKTPKRKKSRSQGTGAKRGS